VTGSVELGSPPRPRHPRLVVAVTAGRSALAFGIGVALLLIPERGESAVAGFMGIYFLISGLFSLAWARRGPVLQGVALVAGIIGVATGILVLGFRLAGGTEPPSNQVLVALGLVIGFTGAFHLVGGFMVGELIDRWPTGHVLLGLLEILLALLLILVPSQRNLLDWAATLWAFSAGSVLAFDTYRAWRRWFPAQVSGSTAGPATPPGR
jgi:hypothetical protein